VGTISAQTAVFKGADLLNSKYSADSMEAAPFSPDRLVRALNTLIEDRFNFYSQFCFNQFDGIENKFDSMTHSLNL
jgi:hypothetical protein